MRAGIRADENGALAAPVPAANRSGIDYKSARIGGEE